MVAGEVLGGTGLVSEGCDVLLPPPHPASRSNADKRTPRAETPGVLFIVRMPFAGMTERYRQLARCSRRSCNRDGRHGGCPDRSRGRGARCARRSGRGRRSGRSRRRHRSHRSHRSHRGRSTFGVIAGVLWITRTSVFATGTTELGSGVTVRVHVAVCVGVGAILRPGGRRPAHWGSQCGRRHQADDDSLHSITPLLLGSVHCSGSVPN